MSVSKAASDVLTVVEMRHCPLCGAVLDPESDALLCPECEVDQAEKWADYVAEQLQARHPY